MERENEALREELSALQRPKDEVRRYEWDSSHSHLVAFLRQILRYSFSPEFQGEWFGRLFRVVLCILLSVLSSPRVKLDDRREGKRVQIFFVHLLSFANALVRMPKP